MLIPKNPFVGTRSGTEFYIPPNIQSDFENYLDTDVPNANFTFEIISDWTLLSDPSYVKRYLRAEMYPINWKSNFANADNTMNFKTDLRDLLQKGDIVIRDDGQIRLLNWKVEKRINDQSTQAQECNHMLTIVRHMKEETDSRGYLVKEAYDDVLVDSQPCSVYQYDGRPAYEANASAPGIAPDALTMVQLQWNTGSKRVRAGDEFDWVVDRYRVINIDYSGIDISMRNGVVRLHAKKVAGASIGSI